MAEHFPITKTQQQWLQALEAKLKRGEAEPGVFNVTRQAATERPFTGKYEQQWSSGTYHCICCGAKLFDSTTKFDAGCGWPSFWKAAVEGAIVERIDRSHGMERCETLCSQCGAHLGHLFDDGPAPTSLRYCMNSAALEFLASRDSEQDQKIQKS